MDNKLYFAKVRPTAKIPTKRDEDAGYDIYADFENDYIFINSGDTIGIPTGIACCVSDDYYLQVEERGSTGSKGLKKSAGIIDSGYRNEIIIFITNTSSDDYIISKLSKTELNAYKPYLGDYEVYPYDKAIAQLIVHRSEKMEVEEISYDELKSIPSKRGIGMLGSSGK